MGRDGIERARHTLLQKDICAIGHGGGVTVIKSQADAILGPGGRKLSGLNKGPASLFEPGDQPAQRLRFNIEPAALFRMGADLVKAEQDHLAAIVSDIAVTLGKIETSQE